MTTYDLYNERWFGQDLRDFNIEGATYTNVCRICRSQSRKGDKNKKLGIPPLMSSSNRMDLGRIDYSIEEPTIVEEMLIARVHI